MTGAGAGSGFGFGRGDRIGFGFAAAVFCTRFGRAANCRERIGLIAWSGEAVYGHGEEQGGGCERERDGEGERGGEQHDNQVERPAGEHGGYGRHYPLAQAHGGEGRGPSQNEARKAASHAEPRDYREDASGDALVQDSAYGRQHGGHRERRDGRAAPLDVAEFSRTSAGNGRQPKGEHTADDDAAAPTEAGSDEGGRGGEHRRDGDEQHPGHGASAANGQAYVAAFLKVVPPAGEHGHHLQCHSVTSGVFSSIITFYRWL